MRLSEVALLGEMPIETFNTVGDFNRSSSFRKEPDRRLLTNPKTVERAKSMWANTQYDFRFWFVNNAEANRFNQVGPVDMNWMQQNMPKTLVEIQQQGGFGPQAINMIYVSNKGVEWRPMTGWMMAHRMAHAVLAPIGGGLQQQPIDTIMPELIEKIRYILSAYEIELPRMNGYRFMEDRTVLTLMKQLGTMKSARTGTYRTGYEFIYETFAQYLISGTIRFNELPDALITGYSYGRPQTRRVYSQVDKSEANYAAEYITSMLEQEFDRHLNGVIGKIVIM